MRTWCARSNVAVFSLLAAGLASTAHGSELRFSTTAAGGIVATGNSLGLSKAEGANGPGTQDSIGTFITLDDTSTDLSPTNAGNPWFSGTSNDWTQNGSEGELDLPMGAEVLHAELLWGGSTAYNTEDVTGDLETPVALSFGGDTVMVAPAPATALTINEIASGGFPANYYMRSADVTNFVASHGVGMYAVGGVPATQDTVINTLNAAGWTLVVAYRNSAERIRNLTVFVGGSFVDEVSTEDYSFEGFCTPPSGAFEGSVVISAIEGDASFPGDSLAVAESGAGPFVALSGPNNPVNNFFASQINDATGNLDVTGTFGDRNHDAALGANVIGGRQSWDVTQVPISSGEGHLANGQTSATVRTETAGDSFVPILVAFSIDVNAPDFSGDGTGAAAAPSILELDQTSTVTVDAQNVGLVVAENLRFVAPLPAGLELESFAIDGVDGDIAGTPVTAATLATGVDLGDIAPQAARQITFEVRSVAAPESNADEYVINPRWDYDYVSCVGEPALTEPHSATQVVIDFQRPADTTGGVDDGSGSGDASAGDASATGTGGDDDASASASVGSISDTDVTATETDSDSFGGGGADGSDGCGCRSQGPAAPLGGLAMLGLLGLRRRRR